MLEDDFADHARADAEEDLDRGVDVRQLLALASVQVRVCVCVCMGGGGGEEVWG